jgi:hypothetical protein
MLALGMIMPAQAAIVAGNTDKPPFIRMQVAQPSLISTRRAQVGFPITFIPNLTSTATA